MNGDAATSLIARLRAVVGDRWTVVQEHELRTYESDGLLQYQRAARGRRAARRRRPGPRVVAACAEAGVPWVARGAGSGLSGGALPVADGVLIVLSRLTRILEIDLDNGRVCVEPGVTNAAVSAAVGPDFFYPPDPSSQIVCTIGGNVAENSGGAHCFKYGFTTNYVTGLEVVLSDGAVVTHRRRGARPARLRPARRVRRLRGHARHRHEDLAAGGAGAGGHPHPRRVLRLHPRRPATAVSAIVQAGIVPGAIEMMDATTIVAAEQMAHAGYPVGRGAALLVELDGAEAECDGAVRAGDRDLPASSGSDDVRVSRDEAERQLFWKTRKAAFPAMGRISPNYFVQDGVVPRTTLPDVLAEIEALATEYGLTVANVFHAGDGNLHPLVCYDAAVEGQAARAEELAGRILDVCLDAGGSITGEHGVGVDKRKHMAKMFGEADLAAFQRLRCAFDPAGPGQPGQGDADARGCAARCPGPTASTRWRPPASRSGSDGRSRAPPPTPRPCCAAWPARAARSGRPAPAAARRGAAPTPADTVTVHTGGLDRIVAHNPGDFTAVLEAGVPLADRAAPAGRARASGWRSTRPTWAARSAAWSPRPTPGRPGTATAASATWSSASPWCSPTARSPAPAARSSRTSPGTTSASCSPARTARSA